MTHRAGWAHGKLIGFDTETTGVDVETARIVTASLIIVDPSAGPVPTTHTWLIDPGVEIPESASEVHGISTERARAEGRPPGEVLAEIASLLDEHWSHFGGAPLIAYNVSYDLTLFDRECVRHGLPGVDLGTRRVVDPLTCDRAVDRYRKGGRKLAMVAAHYGVPLGADAHDATADTLATLRVAWKLAQRYPDTIGAVDLDTLTATQRRWNAAWCRNMASFLEREATRLASCWEIADRNPSAMRFVREKFARLEIAEDPSDESVARTVLETRERAADIAGNADHWPMRPAPLPTG